MSGYIKPSEIYQREIEPAFADFMKEPLSESRANKLAQAIDQQLEWTFEFYQKVDASRISGSTDVKTFRQSLLPQCRELQIMNDLADAAKHRFLTRRNNPPRIVDSSTAAYYEHGGELYVRGPNERFATLTSAAMEFWRNWRD